MKQKGSGRKEESDDLASQGHSGELRSADPRCSNALKVWDRLWLLIWVLWPANRREKRENKKEVRMRKIRAVRRGNRLCHEDHAQSRVFLTGVELDGEDSSQVHIHTCFFNRLSDRCLLVHNSKSESNERIE